MNNLEIIEHRNQRVLTTSQLAESYGTEAQIINNNFNRNRDRHHLGIHYIVLEGNQLKNFKTTNQFDVSSNRVNKLYLWTEKGALLHAKSLNTDKAWEVYDVLIDTYFRVKEMFQVPKSLPEALRYAAELAEQVERQRPLVEFAETISRSNDSILIRELAKICSNEGFKIGQNRLYDKLRNWGLMLKDSTEPKQEYIDRDYFEVHESSKETSTGVKIFKTTRVKPKGQVYIVNRLKKELI